MRFAGYMIALLLTLTTMGSQATDKKLRFIDANFDDFSQRIVKDEEERTMFKVYFSNLVQKIQEAHEKEPEKEKATYRYLYSLALKKLEEKHDDWYKEIQPLVSDPRFTLDDQLDDVRRIIKFFLTRYGAYEEFLNFKASRVSELSSDGLAHNQKSTWETVKDYAVSAKNKVAGWFGFGTEDTSA